MKGVGVESNEQGEGEESMTDTLVGGGRVA